MKTTRRQLMTGGAALAAAAFLNRGDGAFAALPSEGDNGGLASHLRLSLAAYSFRRHLPRGNAGGTMTLHDFMELCARWRLDACEPTSYYFSSEDPSYLHSLKAKAFRLGLDISGTAVGNNFCFPAGDIRDKQIADVKRWIDHSVEFGAPVIRVFAGKENAKADRDTAVTWVVDAMREACDYAGTRGVFLALENHGYLTESAGDVLRILKAVNHEWFGVNLDTGNFHDAPYENMAALAPEAINVQIKVAVKSGGQKEKADFKRIIQMLRDARYRGYVALEYEEEEDPMTAVPIYLDELRAAMETS